MLESILRQDIFHRYDEVHLRTVIKINKNCIWVDACTCYNKNTLLNIMYILEIQPVRFYSSRSIAKFYYLSLLLFYYAVVLLWSLYLNIYKIKGVIGFSITKNC